MRPHCLYLLIALIVLILATPGLERERAVRAWMLAATTLIVLIGGVFAVRTSTRTFVVALILGVLAVALAALRGMVESAYATVVAQATALVFLCHVTLSVLRYVLQRGKITADKLLGAACVYLLLGVTWTTVYTLIETLVPGSFRVLGTEVGYTPTWSDLLYYSLTTLTTLGYGDVTPVLPRVRMLAVLEAACGVLYIALLVARLVALYERQARSEEA